MKKMRKLAALLVASTALFAAGGVAQAVNGVGMTTKPAQIVDTSKKGVIHLTKYDDSKGKVAANGAKNDNVAANPIEGIEFTLKKINGVDFSSNEGLKKAAQLDAASLAANSLPEGITLGDVDNGVQKTNAQGKIDFDNLAVGAYLLTESNSKANDGKTYKAAAPSIVFIPTTDPVNKNAWLTEGDKYAVWVYPKNSLDENVKAVKDTDKQVGEDITFTVTATLPAPGPGEKINDFGFYDKVDPKLDLTGKENAVKVQVGDDELTKDDDFKVWIKDGGKNGQDELTVILLQNGLQKATDAKKANASAKAVLTFDAKVLEHGVIPNQALVYKNTGVGEGTLKPGPGDTPPTPKGWEETNTTTSAWGKVTISKTNEAGGALGGAEFQVYQCTVQGNKGTVTGQPISVNGVNTFTDAADGADDGTITIDGLHVNDAADGVDKAETSYCLVETKAPNGYELRHDPIPFKVALTGITKAEEKYKYSPEGVLISYSNSASVQQLNAEVQSLAARVEVVNIPVKSKLPATGGMGIAIFGLLGAAVIGGGLYVAKRNNRKTA